METIQLREATSPPLAGTNTLPPTRYLTIKHPGYSDDFSQNVLLRLPALDGINGGGLHAGTALTACALVACNAWRGYLTHEKNGEPLKVGEDDVLAARTYYFHVPRPESAPRNVPYQYPVHPSFYHWAFPHDDELPDQWHDINEPVPNAPRDPPAGSAVTQAILDRDQSCVVTRYRDCRKRAHLCPQHEVDWFRANDMMRYNSNCNLTGDTITDDMCNGLSMRADIHRLFDRRKFVFVRKCNQWTIHFLQATFDLESLYHNRPTQLRGVAPQFILARFAWAIFPSMKGFMRRGPPRLVKLRASSEGRFYEDTKMLDPDGWKLLSADTSRGPNSPKKKRPAPGQSPADGETKRICTALAPATDEVHEVAAEGRSEEQPTTDRVESAAATDPYPPKPSNGHIISADYDVYRFHYTEEAAERRRMSALRSNEVRKRRPRDLNPRLICCDHDAADEAKRLGVEGPEEYGGLHLCEKCLG